jgi:hypothetical protein
VDAELPGHVGDAYALGDGGELIQHGNDAIG